MQLEGFISKIFNIFSGVIESIIKLPDMKLEPMYMEIPEGAMALVDRIHYNAQGQKIAISYGDLSETVTEYTYDLRQRLMRLATYQRQYSPDDSLTTVERRLMDYGYSFDHTNNILSIQDHRDALDMASWGVDPWPVPVNYSYHYDSLYRLTGSRPIYHTPQDGRVGQQTWTFDSLGSRLAEINQDSGASSIKYASYYNGLKYIREGESNILPDALYMLLIRNPADDTYNCKHFQYDAMGNLVELVDHANCMTFDETNETCSECSTSYKLEYLWDELGQLIRTIRYEGIPLDHDFIYDDISGIATFTYDWEESRVIKEEDDSDAISVYSLYILPDFEYRSADLEGDVWNGEAVVWNAKVGDHSFRLDCADGQLFTMLSNHVKGTEIIFDFDNGKIVNATFYSVYGDKDLTSVDPYYGYEPEYSYNSKEKDDLSGLYYYGRRYYLEAAGRWVSTDKKYLHQHNPLWSNLDTWNLFNFSLNNPLIYVDLYGLDLFIDSLDIENQIQDIIIASGSNVTVHVSHNPEKIISNGKEQTVFRVTVNHTEGVVEQDKSEAFSAFVSEISNENSDNFVITKYPSVSAYKEVIVDTGTKMEIQAYNNTPMSFDSKKNAFIYIGDPSTDYPATSKEFLNLDPTDIRSAGVILFHEMYEASEKINIMKKAEPFIAPIGPLGEILGDIAHEHAINEENKIRKEMGLKLRSPEPAFDLNQDTTDEKDIYK
jgi:RHS repeat-associated protein